MRGHFCQIGCRIACVLFIPFCLFSCSTNELILRSKQIIMPDSCTVLDSTSKYVFIHIVRNQSCTQCSVESLYQWNNVLSMIGRDDISYLFVVETREEDTPEIIQESLERRPFAQPLFIDYKHDFIRCNRWMNHRKWNNINDFLIEPKGHILAVGDPMNDLCFLKTIKNFGK